MFNMDGKYTLSNHLLDDREDRAMLIATTITFGEEAFYLKKKANKNRDMIITTTGVAFIVEEQIIVTMFALSLHKLNEVFNNKAPAWLKNRVIKNSQKFPQLKYS